MLCLNGFELYSRWVPLLSYHNYICMTKKIITKINAVIYVVSFSLLIVLLSHLAFIKIVVISIFKM